MNIKGSGAAFLGFARWLHSLPLITEIDKKETEPEGWKNVSITKSPVSMTNVLAALLFGILRVFAN